jgi:hypothetical protein
MVGALKFTFWEPYDIQNEVLKANGYAVVRRTPIVEKGGNNTVRQTARSFSVSDVSEFESRFQNVSAISIVKDDNIALSRNMNRAATESEQAYYDDLIRAWCVVSESDATSLGLALLAGELPNATWSENDIAISKYAYEMYALLGYRVYVNDDSPHYENIKINTYQDLIGKKIDDYTVRGIIDTHFDRPEFAVVKRYALGEIDDYDINAVLAFSTYRQVGLHNVFFSKAGVTRGEEIPYIIVPYTEAAFSKDNFIQSLIDGEEYGFYDYYSQILEYQATASGNFGNIMLIISLVTSAFACVLFANFIMVSIDGKRRQIGILRALGATKGNVNLIFVIQNLIVALVVFIASGFAVKYTIMPLLLLMGTTHSLPFPWYVLKVSDFAILFGIIIVTSVVSSLLPLVKLSRKTPRQIINK